MRLLFDRAELPLADFVLSLDLELTEPVTGIFGPSGAGKTSLLETIAGLRDLAAGRLLLDDQVLTDAAGKRFVPPRRRGIGYVAQEDTLFPHLSVRRNLLYGAGPAKEGAGRLDRVLEVLDLRPILSRQPGRLSGGEKRRVALGRALLSSPRLLLLDEPLTGLDRDRKQRILAYLRSVRDEFAVPILYVAHDPEEVIALCTEVLVLARGRLVGRGSPAEVFTIANVPTYRVRGTALAPSGA